MLIIGKLKFLLYSVWFVLKDFIPQLSLVWLAKWSNFDIKKLKKKKKSILIYSIWLICPDLYTL